MKKCIAALLAGLLLLLSGCASPPPAPAASKRDAIPFLEGQLYAVAYLGYGEMEDLTPYEPYLDDPNPPVCLCSEGEFYLIIPRYPDMTLTLSRCDHETSRLTPFYEQADGRPLILRCNASDIFADAVVGLSYKGDRVEFSPYISLRDGSVQIGERGLDLTGGVNPS